VLNNDGGGIFHRLPIESFDPPFTEQFKTPHGLTFGSAADLYGAPYEQYGSVAGAAAAVESAVGEGTRIVEVTVDGEQSRRARAALPGRVCDALGGD